MPTPARALPKLSAYFFWLARHCELRECYSGRGSDSASRVSRRNHDGAAVDTNRTQGTRLAKAISNASPLTCLIF